MSRSRSLVRAFKDPVTRPRAIVWTGTIVLGIAAVAVAAGVIGTSTRAFCAEICHQVQDDTIASYEASSHSEISCMACHEPVNASTMQLVVAKLRSAGEIYPTVTNTFDLPLNPGSAYALNATEMSDAQCTQCHSEQRVATPSDGRLIDHAIHAKAGITCTTCHNRVAHPEDGITLKLPGNRKHADFMEMEACFRCHDLAGAKRASGTCATCHTDAFDRVPASHRAADWAGSGHVGPARNAEAEFTASEEESAKLIEEGVARDLAAPVEGCLICHPRTFCEGCHSRSGVKG